jgi:beta-glucanase (GH16 family)
MLRALSVSLALLALPLLMPCMAHDTTRGGEAQFECIVGQAHTAPWHPPLPPGPHHCLPGCSWNGSACTLRTTFTELLWQDEFGSLNTSSWQVRDYASWMCTPSSTGCVAPEAVKVSDGALRLRTEYHPTAVHPHQSPNVSVHYTTGSVDSSGRRSFGPFGRFEARAKVAHGHGLNSALWLMPAVEGSVCPWPRCGEIDIMECLGKNTSIGYGDYHWAAASAPVPRSAARAFGCDFPASAQLSDDFHTYGVLWTEESMWWYVDTTLYCHFSIPKNATQTAMYWILDTSVGGDWAGAPVASEMPAEHAIDAVRVFGTAALKPDATS